MRRPRRVVDFFGNIVKNRLTARALRWGPRLDTRSSPYNEGRQSKTTQHMEASVETPEGQATGALWPVRYPGVGGWLSSFSSRHSTPEHLESSLLPTDEQPAAMRNIHVNVQRLNGRHTSSL
jgi:hypothetical protein